MKLQIGCSVLLLLWFSFSAMAQDNGADATDSDSQPRFHLTSRTFENNGTLPISMINNNPVNGVNTCSLDGSPGGNKSPELSWRHANPDTVSFVVVAYDTTAAFTHWGCTTFLPLRPDFQKMQVFPEASTVLRCSMTSSPVKSMTVHALRRA